MGRSSGGTQSGVGINEIPRRHLTRPEPPTRPEDHYPEHSYCSTCGAIYQDKHWVLNSAQAALLRDAGTGNEVTCPACRIEQGQEAQGELVLRGGYWPQHRELIENLMRNEANDALGKNPLERIVKIETADSEMLVTTTTAKLAQRLGRALHGAHKGTVDYHWSQGHTCARVYWERNE